jgi:signal transduction histidine kinase
MRWRIRYQLLLPCLILLLGIVAITTWNAISSARRVREQLQQQVRQTIHSLNRATQRYPIDDKNVLELAQGLSGAEIVVIDGKDERHSTLAQPVAELPSPGLDADDWDELVLDRTVLAGNERYLCGAARITSGRNAGADLYVLYPEALLRRAQWAAVQPALFVGGFAGLVSLILAVAVGERTSRRIQDLERRTRQIAEGDFGPMPLPGRDDELRDLGQSVNEMARKLAVLHQTVEKTERLRLLGQLSAGLAHQLRNSATGARLAVQLHLRECAGKFDSEALEVALRQLTLLESNLKRFLELGRTEHGRPAGCSIVALVDEAVRLFGPQCRHSRVELRWRKPVEEAFVCADAGQMTQVLINLLDNALGAAGQGGWVELVIARNGDCCEIEVRDSGRGPPPELIPRLFEPFATSKPEGVGLGLAVSRQIAEAHGGRLVWARDEQSTVFRLVIPLVKRPADSTKVTR